MPKRTKPQTATQNKNSTLIQQSSLSYSAPIPPPQMFEEYDRVLPGSAERILSMAEKQTIHRISLEEKVVSSNINKESLGMWMAFLITMTAIIGGIIIILDDKSAAGLQIIITSLVILVGIFIYGRHSQMKERKEKNLS